MEATTNKVGIDLELRPDLKKAEGEFNSFINQIVSKVKTLDTNLQKLGEGGRLTGSIRKKAEEALYSTTEAAYGFSKGLDPATIAGLGGERAISTAIGANLAKPLKEAQGTLRKYRDDMDSAIVDTERVMSKHTRMIPAYLGTVINTVGQAVQMYANLYRAEKLAFDFGSPSGMATALMQYDITRTQTLWGGGGRILGSVAGGIIGGVAGGMPGALAGSYLGSQILGEAGSAIGLFSTADKEQKLKMFQEGFGRTATAAKAINPIESLIYNIMARNTGKTNYGGMSNLIKSGVPLGYSPAQSAQMAEAYSRAGGSMANFESYQEFARAERGTMGGMTALMTPKSQAEQAFMFSALRKSKPTASLMDIQLMMRGGINDPTTRKAMLDAVGGVPKGLRDYYILAMTEGKGVGAEETRALMKEFDTGGGGAFGAGKILDRALKNVAPGEIAEARTGVAQYDLGEKSKKWSRDLDVAFETQINAYLETAKIQNEFKDKLKDATDKFIEKFMGGDEKAKEEEYKKNGFAYTPARQLKESIKSSIKDLFFPNETPENYGEGLKEEKSDTITPPALGTLPPSFQNVKVPNGTLKVETKAVFVSDLPSSKKRPVKVASK